MSTKSRLDRLYQKAERVCFDERARIVIMSDCHRGVGNHGDNFGHNSHIFFAALQFYETRRFTYMELGDGDELWENKNYEQIIRTHSDIFRLLSGFHCRGQFIMFYGNHDRSKAQSRVLEKIRGKCYCDSNHRRCGCFPELEMKEALVLQEAGTGNELLLVHGHQGDFLNDTLWRLTGFLVRHVWRRLELWGIQDPTSAAKNYKRQKKIEKKLAAWADKNKVMLIAGHTHRSMLPMPKESLYCNDGSCVHPRCITALEIERGHITLVKWCVLTNTTGCLYVGREVLEGPFRIKEYFQ